MTVVIDDLVVHDVVVTFVIVVVAVGHEVLQGFLHHVICIVHDVVNDAVRCEHDGHDDGDDKNVAEFVPHLCLTLSRGRPQKAGVITVGVPSLVALWRSGRCRHVDIVVDVVNAI